MKCATTLKELISSYEFCYLEDYRTKWHFNTRSLAYSERRRFRSVNPDLHVCYNPALNCYTIVFDCDYKQFKLCAAYIKKCYAYLERTGVL